MPYIPSHLLQEVFINLPARILLTLKSVCKPWCSAIEDVRFLSRHNELHPIDSCFALILQSQEGLYLLKLNSTFSSHTNAGCHLSDLLNYPNSFVINSCNGLLLCGVRYCPQDQSRFFVFNPTTKCCRPITSTQAETNGVFGMCLAFDPRRSTHFQVACTRSGSRSLFLYSSGSGLWKKCDVESPSNVDSKTKIVYWNGAFNWLSLKGRSRYFGLKDEEILPLPKPRYGSIPFLGLLYFGVSRDHLHAIPHDPRYRKSIEFDIYKMKGDHDYWFIKFHVDFSLMQVMFRDMWGVNPNFLSWDSKHYSVLEVLRSERDEDACLIIRIGGDIFSVNWQKKVIKKLFSHAVLGTTGDDGTDIHQYIANFSVI